MLGITLGLSLGLCEVYPLSTGPLQPPRSVGLHGTGAPDYRRVAEEVRSLLFGPEGYGGLLGELLARQNLLEVDSFFGQFEQLCEPDGITVREAAEHIAARMDGYASGVGARDGSAAVRRSVGQ